MRLISEHPAESSQILVGANVVLLPKELGAKKPECYNSSLAGFEHSVAVMLAKTIAVNTLSLNGLILFEPEVAPSSFSIYG